MRLAPKWPTGELFTHEEKTFSAGSYYQIYQNFTTQPLQN
jgi:hypothetical protein